MERCEGLLLGGRVHYVQAAEGFRTGIEPVLLAAAIEARPGERVLEGGTGAGAALLCLAHRVPGITGRGIERDPAIAALARENLAANGFADIDIQVDDLESSRIAPGYDHAFANPPYHLPGTVSPQASREKAKRGPVGLLERWITALAAPLRHRGTLTLILPAARLPEALTAMAAADCGAMTILPLWPKAGRPAKLTLLRGVRARRSPCRLLPGLVLHAESGFTPAAEAILRDGATLIS